MKQKIKPKLLIATDSFLPRWDGVSRFLLELVPKLVPEYNITIVAPDFKGCMPKMQHIKIKRVPLSRMTLGDYTFPKLSKKKIVELVKDADIIFSQTIGPIGSTAVRYAKKKKKKTVSYVHSYEWELFSEAVGKTWADKKYLKKIVKFYVRSVYNKCNLLMVPSSNIAKKLIKLGVRPKKEVVMMGVDTKKFSFTKNRSGYKRKLRLPKDSIVLGYHGRLGKEKNLETLYKAFSILSKKNKQLRLLVIGEGIDEYKDMLKGRKIRYITSANNIVPYIKAMDIYVLPSLTETSSLSTMEAMACGNPVVVTPVGNLLSYIHHGINGLFFETKNYKDLKSKIELLINNPELRASIGKNARKTIIDKFQFDDTASRIIDILNKIR